MVKWKEEKGERIEGSGLIVRAMLKAHMKYGSKLHNRTSLKHWDIAIYLWSNTRISALSLCYLVKLSNWDKNARDFNWKFVYGG